MMIMEKSILRRYVSWIYDYPDETGKNELSVRLWKKCLS